MFKQLTISDLPENSSYLICGGRRSGKSICLKAFSILKNGFLERSDFLIVFSLSVNYDFFSGWCEKVFIWNEESIDKIQAIIDKQTKFKEKYGKLLRITIILDDVLGDNKSKRNIFLQKLFSTCRHYKINLIYIVQTLVYTKEWIRNVDCLVYFPDGIRILADKKFLKEQILINYVDQEVIDKIDTEFGKHEALVALLTAERDTDIIFKFKAPENVINYNIRKKNIK